MMERQGITSLDAGAPNITYEGNEGPKAPQQMADALLREEYDKYIYDLLEQRPDAMPMSFEEFRQMVIAEGKMSSVQSTKPTGIQMASNPSMGDEMNQMSLMIFKKPLNELTDDEYEDLQEYIREKSARGGRIGYNDGGVTGMRKKLFDMGYDWINDADDITVKEIFDSEMGTWTDSSVWRPGAAKGGRIGFQTGGTTQDQRFQPEYIEALGKTYAADLTRQAGIPAITQATQQMPGETLSQFQQRQDQAKQFDITQQSMGLLAPQVAAQDPMQAAAYTQATATDFGLGAYQPYATKAATAADAAGALTGPMTTAQRTAYMSPYQQDVIDATMTEFDAQAQRRENQRAANALGVPGAYGGGREGVQKAVYQTESDQNRAAMLAQLRQQGFQQAQAGRQQDFVNQQALATQQSGLGTQALGNVQRQIAGLGTLGATQQVQNQAVLDAQRQFASMAVNEPQQRLGMLGQGVTGLMGGMQGYGTTIGQAPPQTSPLGTALGIGSTLAGIYGMMNK